MTEQKQIANSSRIHEYQLAAMIALSPEIANECTDAEKYLAYPETQSLWKAIKKVRELADHEIDKKTDDPLLLASLMVADGYKEATPELIRDKILLVGREWPAESIPATIAYLRDLYERREGDRYMAYLQNQIQIGKINFDEAEELFAKKRLEISGIRQDYILRAENAAEFAENEAKRRTELMKSGKGIIRPPRALTRLWNNVVMELDTLILITGRSGGGKSVLSEMIAEHLAYEGEKVDYICTELTKAQMIWRRIARVHGVSYNKLRMGFWQPEYSETLRPYTNGGGVDYIEAGGMKLGEILQQGKKDKAHIILDYWDMLDLSSVSVARGLSFSKTDMVGFGLADAKAYAQHEKRLVIVVQQYGKDEDAGPMDSARFKHRANLWLKINTEELEDDFDTNYPVPENGKCRQIHVKAGNINPICSISIGKDTFGGMTGLVSPVFLDGARFRFIDTVEVNINDLVYGTKTSNG